MSMGFSFFTNRRKSCHLSQLEFEALCASAEVLEQDAHGLKVLKLQNGDILKIFRVKRFISSARLYSYARHFCRNATRLKKLNIPTVSIKQLYHLSGTNNSAVLYEPLQGSTLRDLLYDNKLEDRLLVSLGAFIAYLHDQGVYFRSLHFGNIVLTINSQMGLIDIADMSIFPWKLGCGRRLRNFYHVRRLKEDMSLLGARGWQIIHESYLSHSNLAISCESRLKFINATSAHQQADKNK